MSPRFAPLLLTTALAVVLDALTKGVAERALPPHVPRPVLGDVVRLTLGYNPGVAFGALAGAGGWVLVVSGVGLFAIGLWLWGALRSEALPRSAAWGGGLLLGGGLANLLDRLPDGTVTDFIDVGLGLHRWPTFNLADVCILLGVGVLLLTARTPGRSVAPADAASTDAPARIGLGAPGTAAGGPASGAGSWRAGERPVPAARHGR